MQKSTINGANANTIILIGYIGGLILRWIPSVCYLSWLLPFIIYILEKENTYIKKHMTQATTLYLVSAVLSLAITCISFAIIPIYVIEQKIHYPFISIFYSSIILLCAFVIGILVTVYAIIATIKSWNYQEYTIPFIDKLTPYVQNILRKINNEKEEPIAKHTTKTTTKQEQTLQDNKPPRKRRPRKKNKEAGKEKSNNE